MNSFIHFIDIPYPQVGQAVKHSLEQPKCWLEMTREELDKELPMETIGIIDRVNKDTVFYIDYLGQSTSFLWKFINHDQEWKVNKLYNWHNIDYLTKLQIELARKYKQTLEQFHRDITGYAD